MPATVEVATEVTPELVDAFARLIPQLSSSNPPPSAEALADLVASPVTTVLIARSGVDDPVDGGGGAHDGSIIGTLTLVTFRIPTGVRSWIEDVVVDGSARGQGAGEALTLAALDEARRRGASTVDLTSRPAREAANRLYARLGFELRTTNCYRYTIR